MAKMRRKPDQLIAELTEHVVESVQAASAGDVEAKQWLLWAFPGNVAQFRQVWSKPALDCGLHPERLQVS